MRKTQWLALLLALLMLPLVPVQAEEAAENSAILMVRCGGSFVYAIDQSGNIWGWGDNRKGQLAHPDRVLMRTPRLVAQSLNGLEIADIQCGNENTLFLMKDGTVYGCGANGHSQLGIKGLRENSTEPLLIPTLSNIVQIDSGFGQSLALDADGRVWSWGYNNFGQVGTGDRTTAQEPIDIGLENIVQIGCGGKYSMALAADGTVYAWGENDYGQVMAGRAGYQATPTAIDLSGHKISQIATGGDVAFMIDDEGHVWAWGRNDFFQCGNDTIGKGTSVPVRVMIPDEENIVRVIAYSSHTMALTDTGRLWFWGASDMGERGDGTHPTKSLPIISKDSGVIDASVGSLCCALLLEDGTVQCTGFNKYGQLGIGTRTLYDWISNGLNLISSTYVTPSK